MYARSKLVLLTIVLGLAVVRPSLAAPTPTPEQLRMFQQLPASQREALMRQYLGGQGATRGNDSSAATEGEDASEPGLRDQDPAEQNADAEPTDADRMELKRRAAKERETRDLAWCKREQRLADERERVTGSRERRQTEPTLRELAEQARAQRQMGYPSEQDLPLPERCLELLERDAEQRFDFKRADVEPFGYDLFESAAQRARSGSTARNLDSGLPVSADYTLGPGDTLAVQLFGKENQEYSLLVSRDGAVQFPGLGPIVVAGLRFDAAQRLIEQRVGQQMIGVRASVTMGQLRSIRVFVLGDAVRPGSYPVSAQATITQALYASGGIRETGSLRDIQLKRDGKLVRRLDLYDLLLAGNTADDVRLQAGDAVFIPPRGATVAVEGEVVRPAIYELDGEANVSEVVAMAGGLTPNAHPQSAVLERIGRDRDRTVVDLDLSTTASGTTRVLAGDRLQVSSVLEKLEDVVRIVGHVHRPRFAQWREGMRISDLIPDPGVLKPKADLEYLMIRRELRPSREVQVVSANLVAALADKGGAADVLLEPRDQVFTFGIDADRVLDVKPVLEELRTQARKGLPARIVGITGSVRAPGEYPLEPGMKVSDLLRAAGQLAEDAFLTDAELTRFSVTEGERREIEHVGVDLAAIVNGNAAKDLLLEAYDVLNVKPVANWNDVESVEVGGEVRFPGRYPVRKGETLQSVLERAGGLTTYAFPAGAVLTRIELQRREQEQLDRLAEKLSRELTALSLEQAQSDQSSGDALRLGEQIASELRGAKALGRLVIDLDAVMAGQEVVIAKGGDRLVVPRRTQEVTVIGEVQYSTSHLHDPDIKRNEYIERSGGMTAKADKSRVFVVRANGRVDVGPRSGRIQPGDTVVVPLDTERMRPLVFWSTISQIVYQIALTAASAKTVGAI